MFRLVVFSTCHFYTSVSFGFSIAVFFLTHIIALLAIKQLSSCFPYKSDKSPTLPVDKAGDLPGRGRRLRFSAEKPRRLQQSPGLLPGAAFRSLCSDLPTRMPPDRVAFLLAKDYDFDKMGVIVMFGETLTFIASFSIIFCLSGPCTWQCDVRSRCCWQSWRWL